MLLRESCSRGPQEALQYDAAATRVADGSGRRRLQYPVSPWQREASHAFIRSGADRLRDQRQGHAILRLFILGSSMCGNPPPLLRMRSRTL